VEQFSHQVVTAITALQLTAHSLSADCQTLPLWKLSQSAVAAVVVGHHKIMHRDQVVLGRLLLPAFQQQ
jgi:hypothetical protein